MNEIAQEQVLLARERTSLAHERSHFAQERTFLAWMRTGLASVGGGVAIIRLLIFQQPLHILIAKMIGCVLVFLGIAIFILSYLDYRHYYKQHGEYKSFAGSLLSISFLTLTLILISTGLLAIIL